MATRTLAIRDAIVTELLKIGVDPASGWESGAGAPTVTAGRPKRDAIAATPERQVWVQHVRTEPQLEGSTAAGEYYRAIFNVRLVCPNPDPAGEELVSKLERDVRRAIQNSESILRGTALANAGIFEGDFEANDELLDAGMWAGIVRINAFYLTTKGDP